MYNCCFCIFITKKYWVNTIYNSFSRRSFFSFVLFVSFLVLLFAASLFVRSSFNCSFAFFPFFCLFRFNSYLTMLPFLRYAIEYVVTTWHGQLKNRRKNKTYKKRERKEKNWFRWACISNSNCKMVLKWLTYTHTQTDSIAVEAKEIVDAGIWLHFVLLKYVSLATMLEFNLSLGACMGTFYKYCLVRISIDNCSDFVGSGSIS